MPIYEYEPNTEAHCEFCQSGFECIQKVADAALLNCPECGAPISRKLSAPNLARSSPSLDPANIEKHGFTQYKRSGKGVYEKTAGKGPDIITDD